MNNPSNAQQTTTSMEFWDWLEVVQEECLTIEDMLRLEPGEELKVLSMHRNLCDRVYPRKEPGPVRSAEEFFVNSVATYVHRPKDGLPLQGTLSLPGLDDPLSLELHVQYNKHGYWYPLEGGKLPPFDGPDCDSKFADGYVEGKSWDQFPVTTCVGYRGPFLLASKLKKLPDVFTNIDVQRLATYAAMDWLKGAGLPVPSDRIWLQFEGGELVVTVHDLTETEKVALGHRLSGATIKRWRAPTGAVVG